MSLATFFRTFFWTPRMRSRKSDEELFAAREFDEAKMRLGLQIAARRATITYVRRKMITADELLLDAANALKDEK